jgi:hypothetical protein
MWPGNSLGVPDDTGGPGTAVTWTRQAIEVLGPVTAVPTTTAAVLDGAGWTVAAAVRRGDGEIIRLLRRGRRIRIPTANLVAATG